MARALGGVLVLAALLVAAPVPAGAQDRNPRPYVGFSGFLVQLEEDDILTPAGPAGSVRVEPDDGLGFAAALGTSAPAGARVELEAAFRTSDVDRICAASCLSAGGQTESLSLMLNGLYDLPTGIPVRPYFGAGAGMALVAFESTDIGVDGDDWVFAYQFLAGLGVEASRRLTLFAGYRYFATQDARISGVDVDYRAHNFEVGVRVGF